MGTLTWTSSWSASTRLRWIMSSEPMTFSNPDIARHLNSNTAALIVAALSAPLSHVLLYVHLRLMSNVPVLRKLPVLVTGHRGMCCRREVRNRLRTGHRQNKTQPEQTSKYVLRLGSKYQQQQGDVSSLVELNRSNSDISRWDWGAGVAPGTYLSSPKTLLSPTHLQVLI